MKDYTTIPYQFLRQNYFLLDIADYGSSGLDFRFRERTLPDFDGTIGDYLDELDRKIEENKSKSKRDIKHRNKIITNGPYIATLYDLLDGEMPFTFVSYFFDDVIYGGNKNRFPKDILECDDHAISIRAHLKKCGYSISMESECHMLGKLAAYGQKLMTLYDSYISFFENGKPVSDDVTTCVRSFIESFIKYKEKVTQNERVSWDPLMAFKLRFKYCSTTSPYDNSKIATMVGLTVENVRVTVRNHISESRKIMEYQYRSHGVYSDLARQLKVLKNIITEHLVVPVNDMSGLAFLGDMDEYTLSFVLDFLDAKAYDMELSDEMYVLDEKLKKEDVEKAIRLLRDLFDENPLPIDLSLDFESMLAAKKISNLCKDLCRSIAIMSGMFIRESDGDSETLALKYQYLKTIPARIVRILYEKDNNAMYKSDILMAYNRYAKLYGEKEISDLPRVAGLIEPIGKSGVWRLNLDGRRTSQGALSLKGIIKKYICNLDRPDCIAFRNLYDYIQKETGEVYKENSVRTILNTLGYMRNGDEYVINMNKRTPREELLQAIVEILALARKPMQKQELIARLRKHLGTSVNDGSVMIAINSAPELLSLERRGLPVYVTLIAEDPSNIDFGQYRKERETPYYHNNIIQTAIDELLRVENHTMPLRELKRVLEKQIPLIINDNIIYKFVEREPLLSKTLVGNVTYVVLAIDEYRKQQQTASYCFDSDGSREVKEGQFTFEWSALRKAIVRNYAELFSDYEDSRVEGVLDCMYRLMKADDPQNASWKIMELLNRICFKPTTDSERELLAFKLIFETENYLRNVCEECGCYDMPDGLSAIINSMQHSGILPARYVPHKLNRRIGPVISIRNEYAHIGNSEQVVSDNIKTFLCFYYLVAEYVMVSGNLR